MTPAEQPSYRLLSFAEQAEIGAVCDAFEESWRESETPSLAEAMRRATHVVNREVLFRELLKVEWELRVNRGETIDVAQYRKQFVEWDTIINEMWERRNASFPTPNLHSTWTGVEFRSSSSSRPGNSITSLGEYELHEEIAHGGMGVVFKAKHRKLGRLAAIKLIRAGSFASADEVKRFCAEAATAADLDHPCIVPVYDFGEDQGQYYIAMAYVPGTTLWKRVQLTPLDPRQAARLMKSVAEAIQYAHDRGILHRDLKPQNILLSNDGEPRVTDFGLAKRQLDDSSLTVTGMVLGTPGYLPPEQALGRSDLVGPGSDVYSLGATLYAVITGRAPFQAATAALTLQQVLEMEPISPRTLNPAVPLDLDTICRKCLHKELPRRYLSAKDLADDLGRYLAGEPIQARPVSQLERSLRWCYRNPWLSGSSLLAVSLLIMIAVISSVAYYRERGLAGAMSKLAGEKTKLADEKTRLADEMQVTMAEMAFTNGIQKRNSGQTANAAQDFFLATSLLKPDHPREREFRAITWDTLNQRGRSWSPLWKHEDEVRSACFSPDGRLIASGSYDNTIRLWDVGQLRPRGQPLVHDSGVRFVTFNPRGSLLAGLDHQHIRIWNVTTGLLNCAPMRAAGSPYRAEFSSSGEYLISLNDRRGLQVWDVKSGTAVGEPIPHGESFEVFLDKDGNRLATFAESNSVQVWDVATRTPLGKPLPHEAKIHFAHFSADGGRLVTACEDKLVRVWDVQSGDLLGAPLQHDAAVRSAYFITDGSRVFTSTSTSSQLWDTQKSELIGIPRPAKTSNYRTLLAPARDSVVLVDYANRISIHRFTGNPVEIEQAHRDIITSITFSPDGTRLATSCRDGTARIWDTRTGKQVGETMQHRDAVWSTPFSPDGTLLVTASKDQTLRVWTADDGNPPCKRIRIPEIASLKFVDTAGDRVILASAENDVQVWDLETQKQVGISLSNLDPLRPARFSLDGTRIITVGRDHSVQTWNTATGESLCQPIKHGSPVVFARFSPDGNRIVSVAGNLAQVWTHTGFAVSKPFPHQGISMAPVFSPDASRLLTTFGDHMVRLWDLETGTPIGEPLPHKGVEFAEFSADGTRLLTAGLDKYVRVWNVAFSQSERSTPSLIGEPMLHDKTVRAAHFSPTGKHLVAVCFPDEAVLWDLESGTEVGAPMRHEAGLATARFDANGERLLTAGSDGKVCIWNAKTSLAAGEPLIHRTLVNFAAFSNDGLIIHSLDFSNTSYYWSLEAKIPGRDVLPAITELWTHERKNDRGELTRLKSTEWLALAEQVGNEKTLLGQWQQQRQRYQERRALDWHLRMAEAAESNGEWFVAAFHWQQLMIKQASRAGGMQERWQRAITELNAPRPSPARGQ